MGRNYSQADIKVLWGAAAICSHPNCNKKLVAQATEEDEARSIGKICHIVASSDDGPRGDPDFPTEKRDDPENLILLCGTHHDEIDVQPNTYSIETLRKWKADHERWVDDTLSDAVVALTFAELERVAKALVANPPASTGTLALPTPPARKMRHNGLTAAVASNFQIGQLRFHDVERFIGDQAGWDVDFGERLKAGFAERYDALWERGLRGDDLYIALAEWAGGGPRASLERRAAGAAILSYLFHICDVFEPEPDDDSADETPTA
ncbi:MAG: HNH endonuclease [Actinobacteria bacterium]|nr:HNH endonuclease [Actinomycetota bacterium]